MPFGHRATRQRSSLKSRCFARVSFALSSLSLTPCLVVCKVRGPMPSWRVRHADATGTSVGKLRYAVIPFRRKEGERMRKFLTQTVAAVAIAVFWCVSAVGTTIGTTVGVTTLATAVNAVTSTPAEAYRRYRRRRRRWRRGYWGPQIYFGWGGYPRRRWRRRYWW